MTHAKATLVAPTMLALAALVSPSPAAAAYDYKAVTPSLCAPYGNGTTQGELVYTQLGVSNPGTANEAVICTIPVDSEESYGTPKAMLFAFYRAGSVPGKVSCTVFMNNATMSSSTVSTYSANPASYLPANTRGSLELYMTNPESGWGIGSPSAVVCTLTPKALLGGFTFLEEATTNVP